MAMKDTRLEIPCPGCKRKHKVTFRALERNPRLTCTQCKAITNVEVKDIKAITREMDKVDAAFKALKF